MTVRREVLGDAHVDRALDQATPFTAPFQEFITRYAWGSVWTREGLDRRSRSMITLAVLTALGREHELALHVRAARTNGLSDEEIGEVLLHTAVYAGVPAANAAFAIAQQVLAEESTPKTVLAAQIPGSEAPAQWGLGISRGLRPEPRGAPTRRGRLACCAGHDWRTRNSSR